MIIKLTEEQLLEISKELEVLRIKESELNRKIEEDVDSVCGWYRIYVAEEISTLKHFLNIGEVDFKRLT